MGLLDRFDRYLKELARRDPPKTVREEEEEARRRNAPKDRGVQ